MFFFCLLIIHLDDAEAFSGDLFRESIVPDSRCSTDRATKNRCDRSPDATESRALELCKNNERARTFSFPTCFSSLRRLASCESCLPRRDRKARDSLRSTTLRLTYVSCNLLRKGSEFDRARSTDATHRRERDAEETTEAKEKGRDRE